VPIDVSGRGDEESLLGRKLAAMGEATEELLRDLRGSPTDLAKLAKLVKRNASATLSCRGDLTECDYPLEQRRSGLMETRA